MGRASRLIVCLVMMLLSACVVPLPAPAASQTVGEQTVVEHAAHEHAEGLPAELGEVNFPVSCTPEAQAEFSHSMALLHSFEYAAAIDSFNTVAELDPNCAMAHWGVAMSLMEPLWAPRTGQVLVDGWAAVERAMAADAKSPREQAYIDAVAAFYRDADTRDHRTRIVAFEQAMAQLAQDYPEDTEAQIFYALALTAAALPTDKSYANQRQAIEILAPIYAAQPNHPGVAHYLIHSNDYPALAAEGLDAAQRYAAIAPSAPHALHMPSHIFTRLGAWQESIDTNLASAAAAKDGIPEAQWRPTGAADWLHPMDYMMYGYLQLAQDKAAREVLDEVNGLEQVAPADFGAAYALAAMPARYVFERGEWAEAVTLTLHPSSFSWDRFPGAAAVLVFARGLGAARAGDMDTARQALDQLQELHEAMMAVNQGYWAEQTGIQSEAIAAWIALAEEAMAAMHRAAELEAATEKHPVTPAPIVPAQESLGDMLLELGRAEEALAAYEASHLVEPKRFRGLYGAARAAELAGDTEKAHRYYEQLLLLAETADSERAELAAAKDFLAQ